MTRILDRGRGLFCHGSASRRWIGSARHVETRKVHTSGDVIFDPVCVPPFLRIDLYAVKLHREMDVVTSGHAGLPAQTHHLALLYCGAFMHINSAQMTIDRL